MDDVPEMVERVARAMCVAAMVDPEFRGDPETGQIDLSYPPVWRNKIALARAAIAAMREPSQSMIYAGGEPLVTGRILPGDGDADRVWARMIDAALTPTQQPGS